MKITSQILSVLFLTFLNSPIAFNQTETEMYTPVNDVLPATVSANERGQVCTRASTAYNVRYGRISGYKPIVGTPTKTIRIAFHFFQRTDGSNCWPNNSITASRLNTIVNSWMNTIMANNCSPSDPVLGVTNISNSTIQYEIAGVYFYQDDALNTNINPAIFEAAVSAVDPTRLNALPIFVTAGTIPGAAGFGVFPSETNLTQNAYVVTNWCLATQYSDYAFAGHLLHELGHDLDLQHTYDSDNLYRLDLDYLSDVFDQSWMNYCNPPLNYSCYHQAGFNCDPFLSSNYCTNNLMGGTKSLCYISPLQMGKMCRALAIKSVRKYVKEMNSSPVEWIVNQNETWDFDIQTYQDIFITSGATLTIKCKVGMANHGKITVDRGARLILDGGEITAWGTMWDGIIVWGTSNRKQTVGLSGLSPDHGIVRIVNQGTISNAYTGISTIKLDAVGNFDWAYTGGILQCTGARFINNQRAIQYLSYHNRLSNTSTVITPNIGYVFRSLFETNDLLRDPGNRYPSSFITLFDVEGIRLKGNVYQNVTSPLPNYNERGNGIVSIDASYILGPYCSCTNPITGLCGNSCSYPSVFKNMHYGVHASGVTPIFDIIIDNNDFVHCNRGVYMNGISYASIVNNRIDVGDGINSTQFLPYGIYNNHCHGYAINKNVITTSIAGNTLATGIAFHGSGGLGNILLNNNIDRMGVGTAVYGDNRGINPGDGLLLKCNAYGQSTGVNDYDIAILWSLGGVQGRIDEFQGTSVQGANNKFSHNCVTQNDYWDFNDPATYPVQYFYNSDLTTQPLCFSPTLMPQSLSPYNPSMCSSSFEVQLGMKSVAAVIELNSHNSSQVMRNNGLLSRDLPIGTSNKIKERIAELNFEKAFAIDEQIRSLLRDTINEWAQDSIIILLKNDTRADSKRHLLSAYIKFGKYADADNLIAEIVAKDGYLYNFYEPQSKILGLKQKPMHHFGIEPDYGEFIYLPLENYKMHRFVNESKTTGRGLFLLSIYPNPNSGTFTVELPELAKPGTSFRITGLTGQVLREQLAQTGSNMQSIQATDLASGLYFLQVLSEGKVLDIQKFVKQ
ncbi:MAG: T9SS type A sorting domain-containing protein [Saprospiraceae bacterium]